MPRPTPHPGGRHVLPLLFLVLLGLGGALLPHPALAHTRLERSVPARGDTVRGEMREVRLRFSQRAEVRFTGIEITGPGGATVLVGEAAEVPGSSQREFVIPLPAPLAPGAYTVRWRTAGRDGHVIRGSFAFTVAAPPSAVPATLAEAGRDSTLPAPAATPAAATPASVEEDTAGIALARAEMTDPTAPLPVAARWLAFLGLLGMIGAAAFRALVLRRTALHAGVMESVERRARTIGMAAAALSALSLPPRLWLQSAALNGTDGAWSPALLGELLIGTMWGAGWLLQAVGTLLFALGLRAARRSGDGGWGIAAAAAAAVAFSPALSGHAAAVEGVPVVAVAADALHVLGAGAWLGSLAVLLLAGLPAALGSGTGGTTSLAALVNRFSPVALAAAALAAVTGIINALFHLAQPSQLWTTEYGQALLWKTALLLVVAAAGAYNWRVVRPALGQPEAAGRLRRSAALELAVGVLVVAATAVLVALPTP